MPKRYEINGEWDGYYSHQRRIVHREYTTNKDFAAKVEKLGFIQYTDNTTLRLTVREMEKGERKQKELRTYTQLIIKCTAQDENYVANLHKEADANARG